MKKIASIFYSLHCYIFSKTIGIIFFKRMYMTGRYFDNYSSIGWRWIWRAFWFQKVFGFNRKVPWPINFKSTISNYLNIKFDVNDLHIFQVFGCYFQSEGLIIIGKGTWIAPNVGLITSNHNVNNLDIHEPPKNIVIGENCWIGMNAVILPGVVLGNKVIVGAGSIVTKSFIDGNCVIGGNPAKIIRELKD